MNLFKRLYRAWRRLRVQSDPDWPRKLTELKDRLRLLPKDDPLHPLLLGLIDEMVADEIYAGCQASISDEEAHRFRGRLGKLVEFREEFQSLWQETHRPDKVES